MFIDVSTFGVGAEPCATYLAKGRQVGVTGRRVLNEWQAKDGTKRSKHQVIGRVAFGSSSAGNHVPGGDATGDD